MVSECVEKACRSEAPPPRSRRPRCVLSISSDCCLLLLVLLGSCCLAHAAAAWFVLLLPGSCCCCLALLLLLLMPSSHRLNPASLPGWNQLDLSLAFFTSVDLAVMLLDELDYLGKSFELNVTAFRALRL